MDMENMDPDLDTELETQLIKTSSEENVSYANLKIQLSGMRGEAGTLYLSLHKERETFQNKDLPAFRSMKSKITNGRATLSIDQVPFGVYAIRCYQDLNGNGILDMGPFGPKEPVGFSNNARPGFGPPKFEDAVFSVYESEVSIDIVLTN